MKLQHSFGNRVAAAALAVSASLFFSAQLPTQATEPSDLFLLVKKINAAMPLTEQNIKALTGADLTSVSVQNFISQENPGGNPLIQFVHSDRSGSLDLELKSNTITLADVTRAFGTKYKLGQPNGLVNFRPSTDYIFEHSRGWVSFTFDKTKKHQLYDVHFTSK